MEYLIYILVAILAVLFRWDMGFSEACKYAGLEISDTKTGTGLQDAITPPVKTTLSIVLWICIAAIIGFSFYEFGWIAGVLVLVTFFIVSVIAGVFFVSKPSSRHYLQLVYRSMARRYANYERDGDRLRADAMRDLIDRFEQRIRIN